MLTRTQLEELEKGEGHRLLKSKGINLEELGLNEYFDNWRQTTLKLAEENARQAEEIRSLKKQLTKKKKKDK